jgi:hypothetical protein
VEVNTLLQHLHNLKIQYDGKAKGDKALACKQEVRDVCYESCRRESACWAAEALSALANAEANAASASRGGRLGSVASACFVLLDGKYHAHEPLVILPLGEVGARTKPSWG